MGGPPRMMKTAFFLQLLSPEAPLPLVIPTGAQRSGGTCGPAGFFRVSSACIRCFR